MIYINFDVILCEVSQMSGLINRVVSSVLGLNLATDKKKNLQILALECEWYRRNLPTLTPTSGW